MESRSKIALILFGLLVVLFLASFTDATSRFCSDKPRYSALDAKCDSTGQDFSYLAGKVVLVIGDVSKNCA